MLIPPYRHSLTWSPPHSVLASPKQKDCSTLLLFFYLLTWFWFLIESNKEHFNFVLFASERTPNRGVKWTSVVLTDIAFSCKTDAIYTVVSVWIFAILWILMICILVCPLFFGKLGQYSPPPKKLSKPTHTHTLPHPTPSPIILLWTILYINSVFFSVNCRSMREIRIQTSACWLWESC